MDSKLPEKPIIAVMGVFMQDRAVHRAVILRPLILNMDQRPLPAAESEMLKPGELEKVLLGPNHPIRLSVTPSGSAASSTVIT